MREVVGVMNDRNGGGQIVLDDWSSPTDGPAVVLLHGFACNRHMWERQVREMKGSRRVLALDLPGHGESRLPLDLDMHTEDALAELVIDVLEHRGVGSAVLVGFSMGGGVALNLTARRPDLVAGLFLANVGGGSTDPASHRARMRTFAGIVEASGLDALVDQLITTPIFSDYANRDQACHRHMRQIMMTADPRELLLMLDGVLSQRLPVQDRDLESLNVPTRVLVGELDAQTIGSSSELSTRIPGADLVVLGGVGHMTPLEDPDGFNDALRGLLARVDQSQNTGANKSRDRRLGDR